jgi:class 3 adenylate cyclase/CHASE2 domain-containing sensor protein
VKRVKLAPILICGGVIGLFCLLGALTHWFESFHLFQRLELITYDWRMEQASKFTPVVSDKLGFVSIGDDANAIFAAGKLGTNLHFGLKWPRHVFGYLVRELKAQGASAVGLDIFFSELRPDHPAVNTPNGPMNSDAFFAQELKRAGNVVLGADRAVVPHPLFRASASAIGDIATERDFDGVLRRINAFHDYRIWHLGIGLEAQLNNWDLTRAEVQSNQIVFPAPNVGHFTLPLTEDGLFALSEVTRVKPADGFERLQKPFEDLRVWHMGIVLAARELGLDLDQAAIELEKQRITLRATNGVQRIIPVDRQGRMLIDWTLRLKDKRLTTDAFESLVAYDIKRERGEEITNRFRDKIVIVGSTATGNELSDRGATPLEKDTFLTSNYWNVVNSILTGRFIKPSPFLAELLLIVLLGLVAVALTWKARAIWASGLVGLVGVLYGAIALAVFVVYRYWLPLVLPLTSLVGTHFALIAYQAFFEQSERRRIKSVFAKIVSPNVVNELLKAEHLSLVGARRPITVFFADVRGFTELADVSHAQAEAYVRQHGLGRAAAEAYLDEQSQAVLRTVNRYLGLIADTVKRHEGTLDKYIGDCVMAFWGAPTPNERHALGCVRAAIDAQRAVHVLNQERAVENKRREQENHGRAAQGPTPLPLLDLLSVGTGINTGVVTVGLMGSDAHIVNYTVFGREVNLAARLEPVSGRGRIIIGEATYLELLRDDPGLALSCAELPPVRVKGFHTPVKIYEVPWKVSTSPSPATVPLTARQPLESGAGGKVGA